jgi:hypothetical protein
MLQPPQWRYGTPEQTAASLGVLDKAGQAGRLGGGVYRAPRALLDHTKAAPAHVH